jgi:peroxiredoxin
MKHLAILFLLLVVSAFSMLYAQENAECLHPEMGKPIPDMKFSNVKYYTATKLSFSDFRGKWLFIDFWFPGCSNCITTLKPFNELQKEFQKEIQFVLIGINEKRYGGTEALYTKLQQKMELQHIAIFDSLVYNKWCIGPMPHVLVVDPEGILRFVTSGQDLTKEKVKDLIEARPVSLYPREMGPASTPEKTTQDKNTLIYGANISKWMGEAPDGPDVNRFVQLPTAYRKDGYSITALTLKELYKQAYVGQLNWGLSRYVISHLRDSTYWGRKYNHLYGSLYPEPIIEVSDSSQFTLNRDRPYDGGLFNYELVTPDIHMGREELLNMMQQDLKNCFGFEVSIEKRQMPYFKLVANRQKIEKLKSREKTFWISPGSTAAGFVARNIGMKRFLLEATGYIIDKMPLIIDETGIDFNIDIRMDADMTDDDQVIKELNAYGMDIKKGTKEMQVIVIRDPVIKNQ